MEFEFEKYGSVLAVFCSGRFVIGCADQMKERMNLLLQGGCRFMLDMSKVAAIDSAGIAVLIYVLQQARSQGGNVTLACVQPEPRRLLDATGVFRFFDIFETVEAALDSFKG